MTNPYAPPQAAVQDIVDPAAGIVLAERGPRLGAALLDGFLFVLMVYVPIMIGAGVSGFAQAMSGDQRAASPIVGTGLAAGFAIAGIGLIAFIWLNIRFMKANGQSIGKKACGIKVVRTDGARASLSRLIWLRNGVNMVLGIIPLYGFIDALFIFGQARRCIHDYLADTIVIQA
jgi:uncharacterized RDD family membrane protein YckC